MSRVTAIATFATLATFATFACGGNTTATHPIAADDARGSSVQDASGSGSAGSTTAGSATAGSGTSTATATGPGELTVTVTWRDTPLAARSSPGRTSCGTPRPPAVAPTTMWGIPEVVVLVDGASMPLGEVKVTASECAITPRAVVGDRLTITSSAPGPLKLNLAAYGPEPESIDGIPAGIPVLMPIAGHQVTRTLESGLHLLGGTGTGDPIWIVAKPNAVVTDANGQAVFKDLAAGSHVVTAWLPARGGQKPRLVTAKASVTAGTPGELSIDLGQ